MAINKTPKRTLTQADADFLQKQFSEVFATKNDLNILSLIKEGVTEVIKEMDVVTRKDLDYLPSKDEFYEETIKILKGIEDLRDEKDVLVKQASEHSDKIEKLEKIHPKNAHLATA